MSNYRNKLTSILAASVLTGSLLSSGATYANDSSDIERLEAEIASLKVRLAAVELVLSNQQQAENDSEGAEALAALLMLAMAAEEASEESGSTEAVEPLEPIDLKPWRAIRSGLSYSKVEKLLGKPVSVNGGKWATWYYPRGGKVDFYDGEVSDWKEPR